MSDVPFSFSSRAIEELLTKDADGDEEERISAITGRNSQAILSFLKRFEQLARIVDTEVGIGYPNDGTGTARRANIMGGWASASITNTNQLGSGAGAPVEFTHNMDLPTFAVPTTADTYPNVRVLSMTVTHGDRTGDNAAPSATANEAHTSVHFLLGDTVGANSIELRVHSGLTPSATEPINIDIFFTPAVI